MTSDETILHNQSIIAEFVSAAQQAGKKTEDLSTSGPLFDYKDYDKYEAIGRFYPTALSHNGKTLVEIGYSDYVTKTHFFSHNDTGPNKILFKETTGEILAQTKSYGRDWERSNNSYNY